jgi:DNA-binding LytR/AlgR family response regulator
MKVLIIEDEPLAAERLCDLLKKQDPEIEILAHCDSVKKSVQWFRENQQPELLFLDIQLGDGVSFDIFDQVLIDCPVVFTTAYDTYAIDAFRLNSLAYLLKPIKFEELAGALMKYKSSPYYLHRQGTDQRHAVEKVQQTLTREYKKRFLVKTGVHIRSIPAEDILFFYSLGKATYATIQGGKNLLLDYTLEQLEGLLNPACFFRINRKYLIGIVSIADMIMWSNYRLKLVLKHGPDEEILVSREKVTEFRKWLDK